MIQLTPTLQKASFQLEGGTFSTEISNAIFEDFSDIHNKYIDIDSDRQVITLRKAFFKKNKQVQNVTRYYVSFDDDQIKIQPPTGKHPTFQHSSYHDTVIHKDEKVKTIGIILESPHIDEYFKKEDKLVPIAPAQGQTGKKIDDSIESLIQRLYQLQLIDKKSKYRISIIMPVPYQTSLYSIHKNTLNNHYRELRDKIWVKMWTEIPQLKENFFNLLSTFKKDSILINACTKSIKPFVTKELYPFDYKFVLLECNHPTSTVPWVKSLFPLNISK